MDANPASASGTAPNRAPGSPARSRSPRSRTLGTIVAIVSAALVALGFASPVAGGGWAMASVDSIPVARAGETVDVGVTILQHGVTPAVLDDGVAIVITDAAGHIHRFDAAADGAPGHYVAAVTFPGTGDVEWAVEMGWFGVHELGALTISPSGSSPGLIGGIGWSELATGSALVALLLGVVAVAPSVAAGRRSSSSSSSASVSASVSASSSA